MFFRDYRYKNKLRRYEWEEMKVSISILRVQRNAWAGLYQRLSITLKIISILFEKRPDYIPYWLTILGLQNARYKKIEILPHLFQIKFITLREIK